MIVSQLQAEIERSNLSAYRIARRADVDVAQLSRFRNEGRGLSLASAERVANVLGLELSSRSETRELEPSTISE